jgi:hypothetical protein
MSEQDWWPDPPEATRVAARALVLAAVAYRGLIENDEDSPGAEELRQDIICWLDRVGAAAELEPAEADLLAISVGRLDRQATINACWRSEGMVVLAWALQHAALPSVYAICDPADVADAMGFLGDKYKTPLWSPRLRGSTEIEHCANTYLTLHWRLRQYSLKPGTMDFRAFVAKCTWANLTTDGLELIGDELAIEGVRIEEMDEDSRRQASSIVRERHQALNWLLGFESVYSEVTTDT